MALGRTLGQILNLFASPDISVTIFDLTTTGSLSADGGIDLDDGVAINFGTNGDIVESYDNSNAWLQWNDGSNDLLRLSKTSGNLFALGDFLADGGNVGITADPDLLLMAVNLLTLNGALTVVGDGVVGSGYPASDESTQVMAIYNSTATPSVGTAEVLALRRDGISGNADRRDPYAVFKLGKWDTTDSLCQTRMDIGLAQNRLDSDVVGVMTLQSDGKVGIGTATPQDKVAIAGGNLVLDKTSGIGIKVDNATPTFGWRDLLGTVTARNTGASKPTFTTYRDTLLEYQFAAGDEEFFKFHIPHDYVPGTDIHLHTHWSHTGGSVTGGTITLEYEVTYSKGHNQAPYPASVGTTYTGTASVTQYQHIISEVQISASSPSANQVDTDDLEPDGVILARLKVTANNITVSGGGVPDPFIHFNDIHYQSTNMATKQKAPGFYT